MNNALLPKWMCTSFEWEAYVTTVTVLMDRLVWYQRRSWPGGSWGLDPPELSSGVHHPCEM